MRPCQLSSSSIPDNSAAVLIAPGRRLPPGKQCLLLSAVFVRHFLLSSFFLVLLMTRSFHTLQMFLTFVRRKAFFSLLIITALLLRSASSSSCSKLSFFLTTPTPLLSPRYFILLSVTVNSFSPVSILRVIGILGKLALLKIVSMNFGLTI